MCVHVWGFKVVRRRWCVCVEVVDRRPSIYIYKFSVVLYTLNRKRRIDVDDYLTKEPLR